MEYDKTPVLFYDGDCHICNHWTRFVLKWEKKPTLYFASLQSQFCQDFFALQKFSTTKDTLVLWDGESFLSQSDAVLRLSRSFRLPWSLLFVFKLVPKKARDWAYDLFAKHRHRFLKTNECPIPTKNELVRFIQ